MRLRCLLDYCGGNKSAGKIPLVGGLSTIVAIGSRSELLVGVWVGGELLLESEHAIIKRLTMVIIRKRVMTISSVLVFDPELGTSWNGRKLIGD